MSDTLELAAPKAKESINVAGDTVTISTQHLPDDQRDLVRWLYGWIKDKGYAWPDVDREIDIDSTTIYRIFTDRYRYSANQPKAGQRVELASLCAKIKHFKDLCFEREGLGPIQFVETSVFKRIDTLCRESLNMQCFGFIYGEPQVGKTESLKEHQRRNNHGQTIYTLTPAAAGKQEMMRALADACRISSRVPFEQLRVRVTKALDPTKLLILDELHELFRSYQAASMFKVLSILRQMQEVSRCGVVICATNDFRNEIDRGEYAQYLKQFRLRGILELQLEDSPLTSDLNLIAKQIYGLAAPTGDAKEQVKWIGRQWGLGRYCKFLRRANQLAVKKGEKMSWDHFVKIVGIAAELKTKPEDN